MQGHELRQREQEAELGDSTAWRESANRRAFERGAVLELRCIAIAFIGWADAYLGLPRTIPKNETRRQLRRDR
jgi:hypothetical protein